MVKHQQLLTGTQIVRCADFPSSAYFSFAGK